MSVAIIGAGMAGLSCATALEEAGVNARLFDKGRGPGGRMATRRAAIGRETLRFDHGAQYFTARDQRFRSQVTFWCNAGVVAAWPAAGEGAFVGTPGMNGPIKAMAEARDVQWATRIDRVQQANGMWSLKTEDQSFEAKAVVIAVPAEQAAPLCHAHQAEFAERAANTRSAPCWALMAAFEKALPIGDTLTGDGAVSWAARNGAKPGRTDIETWVVHGSPEWSQRHLALTADDAAEKLLRSFFELAGLEPARPIHLAAHRWRYAMAEPVEGPPALWSSKMRLGVAGDWLLAPRVESAWISGRELADRMLADASFMETV